MIRIPGEIHQRRTHSANPVLVIMLVATIVMLLLAGGRVREMMKNLEQLRAQAQLRAHAQSCATEAGR